MKSPRVQEFVRFHRLLMKDAPKGYEPFFLLCEPGEKNPDRNFGSWKAPKQKITFPQAVNWMKCGWNIGIAGTDTDDLVIMDIDDPTMIPLSIVKPTLTIMSRKRAGYHCYYFGDIKANIPTDHGELRTNWQFVVAPGSYVETDPETVPKGEQHDAGYYTIHSAHPVESITYTELPEAYRKIHTEVQEQERTQPRPNVKKYHTKPATTKTSAVFNITAEDVVQREGGKTTPSERWASVFHGSDTGKNTSLSQDGLIQCWRCNVSHNGLQALVVLSGYMTCREAGSPHRNSNAGGSRIIGDDGAIFHAWRYAKLNGYIPKKDPIPIKAMRYIHEKHGVQGMIGDRFTPKGWNRILQIVQEEY